METMISDGAIQPFTALGQKTAQMYVKGTSDKLLDYNMVKYCPFCGQEIRIT
jgi:hypothetical protein